MTSERGESTTPQATRRRASTRRRQLREVDTRRLERLPGEHRLLRIIASGRLAELARMEARGHIFSRDECAVQLGISREAVRLIENRIIAKLRAALLDSEAA